MTVEGWDPDEALLLPAPDDEVDEVVPVYRYGVTDWEATHPEPLAAALAQELPDPQEPVDDIDDEWLEVDTVEQFPGRLVADEQERDDDLALAVVDPDDYSPEERAMHIVET